jgi:hypothetical protein
LASHRGAVFDATLQAYSYTLSEPHRAGTRVRKYPVHDLPNTSGVRKCSGRNPMAIRRGGIRRRNGNRRNNFVEAAGLAVALTRGLRIVVGSSVGRRKIRYGVSEVNPRRLDVTTKSCEHPSGKDSIEVKKHPDDAQSHSGPFEPALRSPSS